MANFLTLLLALFAMTAFGESFCDRREGENEERERVADQRRAVFSVCMSFLDSFATCRRAGSRRQSACRRQPLSPFFFVLSPLHPPPHTQTKKQPPPPPTPGAGEQRRDWGAFSSLFDLLFPSRCPPPPVSLLQPHSKTTQPRKNLCLSFLQGLALRRRSRRRGRRRRHRRWRRNRLRRRQQPEQQLLQQ